MSGGREAGGGALRLSRLLSLPLVLFFSIIRSRSRVFSFFFRNSPGFPSFPFPTCWCFASLTPLKGRGNRPVALRKPARTKVVAPLTCRGAPLKTRWALVSFLRWSSELLSSAPFGTKHSLSVPVRLRVGTCPSRGHDATFGRRTKRLYVNED